MIIKMSQPQNKKQNNPQLGDLKNKQLPHN